MTSSRNNVSEESHTYEDALRVVIVAPRIEHLIGGQEVEAQLLLRSWRDDPAVHVSYLATNLQLPNWIERIPYLRTLVRFPLYVVKLFVGLRKTDIVHVFSGSYSSFLIATVPAYSASRILGKKVLVHYHSPLAHMYLSDSWIARTILKRADKVVGPSSYFVDVFGKFGIAVEAIPNLIDWSIFSYRRRYPLRPFVLCSRNLEARYGIDIVVRAFAEVQKSSPEARLWILGEGPQEATIRHLIADLGLKRVEMPGRVPRERIGEFYDKADILINASRVDSMPVSILEAFASGIPVITTNAGGIPYFVHHEDTGMLSDVDDWKQLAANAIRLLGGPELVGRITQHAYEQALAYGWDSVRQGWLTVYRSLGRS